MVERALNDVAVVLRRTNITILTSVGATPFFIKKQISGVEKQEYVA